MTPFGNELNNQLNTSCVDVDGHDQGQPDANGHVPPDNTFDPRNNNGKGSADGQQAQPGPTTPPPAQQQSQSTTSNASFNRNSSGSNSNIQKGQPPPKLPTPQDTNKAIIEKENSAFKACASPAATKEAMAMGAAKTALDKDPSATKAAVNMSQEVLDLQNECLSAHPLAALSPNYHGIPQPGDLGRVPDWMKLLQ